MRNGCVRIMAILLLVTVIGVGISSVVYAGTYPSKPIQLIVPWKPGGGSDTQMRIVAHYMEKYLKVPVPVINKPGVSGTLGLKEFMRMPPDGYHIAQIHDGLVTAHYSGVTTLNYTDFEIIGAITDALQYLIVNADTPWKTAQEFLDYAKKNPKKVKFGLTLHGIAQVWVTELEDASGAKFKLVGYEGTAERIQALLGKFVDAIVGDYPSVEGFVKAGKFRLLACGTPERISKTPNVPTLKELGYNVTWGVKRGLILPKGTPKYILEKLQTTLKKIASDPSFVKKMDQIGARVDYLTSQQYEEYLRKIAKISKRVLQK